LTSRDIGYQNQKERKGSRFDEKHAHEYVSHQF